MKQPIYITGYRKSGTTWLTRLIAQILNSPSGGSIPSQDKHELATEGLDRTGDYIVRKGHYKIVDQFEGLAHTIDKEMIINNPTFFIVRDPRDIVVSAAYFHNKSFDYIVDKMVTGDFYEGRWNEYVNKWLTSSLALSTIHYEDLIYKPMSTLISSLKWQGFRINIDDIYTTVKNQSFETVKKRYSNNSLNNKLMRKGQVGSWYNELPKQLVEKINNEFGDTMRMLGYEIHD